MPIPRDHRLKQFGISNENLMDMIKDRFPEDCELVGIDKQPYNLGLELLVHSPKFDQVPEGVTCPYAMVALSRNEDGILSITEIV